jgi:hypothetical protein
MAWARQVGNPLARAQPSSVWIERGRTPEYTSILRWETSFTISGSVAPVLTSAVVVLMVAP